MSHDRLQLLTQLYRHFRYTLASFVKSSLHRIVLHVVFFRDRVSFLKSLSRFLLLPAYHFQITSQCRNHLSCTGTILAHVFEDRSQHVDVTQGVQLLQEHQQTLIGVPCDRLFEFLCIQPSSLDDLVLLLEHVHNHLRHGSRRHFHLLTL